MTKVILLDIDDTLLSFQQYVKESMKSGFEVFGIGPYREEMYDTFQEINTRLWQELEQGVLSFEELKKIRWNLIFKALGIRADGVAFEAYFRDCLFDSAIPVEGAMELLKALKEKYVLCAASNGPYHQQVNRLKRGGMLSYFSHLFISEEMGCAKPSKEYFDICLKRLNEGQGDLVLPEDVMIVGDSLSSDIAGGIASGFRTLYYNPSRRELPHGICPDYTVEHLKQIVGIL